MAKLNRSDSASPNFGPGNIGINQEKFRIQQNVIGDSLRQLGGSPNVAQGNNVNDPLNAPFKLYVDPYIGKDDVVLGSYSTADNGTFDQEIKRIEAQRLVCGYTESAPFKSINRAIIEAGLITSKDYFSAVPQSFSVSALSWHRVIMTWYVTPALQLQQSPSMPMTLLMMRGCRSLTGRLLAASFFRVVAL